MTCKAGIWFQTLDADDTDALNAHLDAGGSMASLFADCAAVGFTGALTTLKDHLRSRGGCNNN